MGDHVAAVGLLLTLGSSLASFVRVFIFVYIAADPRLHPHVLDPAALLARLNRVQRFLYDVCDPYLRIFRRFLPPLGPLDLSPMVAMIVLFVLSNVLTRSSRAARKELRWR